MAELQAQPDKNKETPDPEPDQTPAGEKATDTPGPVPYDRFKAVNDDLAAHKKQLAALAKADAARQKAEEEADSKRLADQQEWQALATKNADKAAAATGELEALKPNYDKAIAVLEKFAALQMAAVPDIYRPLLEKLPVVERLDWLTENQEKLQPRSGGAIPATPPARGNGRMTDEERRRQAAKTF